MAKSGVRCTPGTVYFGKIDGILSKAIYLDKFVLANGNHAYVLAGPGDGTGMRDKNVTLVGGNAAALPPPGGRTHMGWVRLFAVKGLNGFRTVRPDRYVTEWEDLEASPRFDLLMAMTEDDALMPMSDGAEQFEFSEVEQSPETEEEGVTPVRRKGSARRMTPMEKLVTVESLDVPTRGNNTVKGVAATPDNFRKVLAQVKAPGGLTSSLDGDALVREMLRTKDGTGKKSVTMFGEAMREAMTPSGLKDTLAQISLQLGGPPESKKSSARRDAGDEEDEWRPGVGSSDEPTTSETRILLRLLEQQMKKRRSSDGDSSDDSEDDVDRRGRGTAKLRAYEALKKRQRRKPMMRWQFIVDLATEAGYSGPQKVEMYVHECSKLGKSKLLAYITSLVSRIGTEAAAGESKRACGLAAVLLGFLDQTMTNGDLDAAWKTTMEADPVSIQRAPTLTKMFSLPENAPKNVSHRMKFSAMVPPDVLESTLESAKQWAQWDTAAKAGQ